MRRYGEPVEVRREADEPAQFLWRGNLYLVRTVLAHWFEAGGWWRSPGAAAALGVERAPVVAAPPGVSVDDREREVWRVEAGAGRTAGIGVFDLCYDGVSGAWSLARTLD